MQIQNAPLIGIADRRTSGARVYRVRNCLTVQEAVPVAVADARNEDGWIGLVPVRHVNNVAADVISGNQPIRPKLVLNAQIPLVDVRLLQIERKHGVNPGQWKRAVFVQGNRVGISARKARPRIVERRTVHDNACALRGRVPLPSILVQVREIEKDSVGRSNDGQAITFWIMLCFELFGDYALAPRHSMRQTGSPERSLAPAPVRTKPSRS